jgi:hypothetical protein
VIKQLQYITIVMLVTLLGLLGQACNNTAQEKVTSENRAPMFTLPAATGDQVSLADYQGKQPVLLYFHMAVG